MNHHAADQARTPDRPGLTAVSDGGLRDALRRATADAHRTLEALPLMQAVASGVPSAADYADYLGRQWRVHAPLEARLRPWVPAAWAARLAKTEALAADLSQLGRPLPVRPAEVPPISCFSTALGAMYVLEGATLGLSMVLRRLPDSHPALSQAGRFMAAYGAQTGSRWGEFLRALEAVDPSVWPLACQAASATFSAFHGVFEAPKP